MNWVTNNVGVIITLIAGAVAGVAGWTMLKARMTQLEKDRDKAYTRVDDLEKLVHGHVSDTSLHIDPARDRKVWDDFQREQGRRFDRVEEKIERLMLHIPPVPLA